MLSLKESALPSFPTCWHSKHFVMIKTYTQQKEYFDSIMIGVGPTESRHWIDSHILVRMAAMVPADLILGRGFCPKRSCVFSIWNHAVKTVRKLESLRSPKPQNP